MFVRNWMSSPAVAAPASMEAPAALDLIQERKIRRLPVVDEDGALVGIVTRSDLLEALGRQPTMWRRLGLKLADVMKPNPVTVSPDETLEGAARIMLDHKFGGLPVVENGAPMGMITESDIFRALCEILGFGDKSARLSFTAPASGNLIEELRAHLKDREPRTLMAHLDEGQQVWQIVLRLRAGAAAGAPSSSGARRTA